MRGNRSVPLTAKHRRGQVIVAHGYGVKIRVDRQHLVIDDGVGRERRTRRYARATHGVTRLVVISDDGYVTLGALRWLDQLGVTFVHLDRDGNVIASSSGGVEDARRRRLQAAARTDTTGLEIARYLLGAKVTGHAHVAEKLPAQQLDVDAIHAWATVINEAKSIERMLEAEREAAAIYWSCWANRPITIARHDLPKVPDHWLRFGTRHSPITTSARSAINPATAILNYLYAILEAETRTACLILGLDPGLGIWHADYRSRDSFVLDLMEAARPDVDAFVVNLLATRSLTRREVGETSKGVCRLLPPLARELAQTASKWREAVAPHAEHVVRLLARSSGSRIANSPATPLTRDNRVLANPRRRRSARVLAPPRLCQRCATPLPDRDRTYCDGCLTLPPRERRTTATVQPRRLSSRRCKGCGEPVSHRKRVYCDSCFANYERSLAAMRRVCKGCGQPTPSRKRVYCDGCLSTSRPRRGTGPDELVGRVELG